MKSKGITIWELHVEKMVLGVAVLAAGYFAATQFIGNPNAATIGSQTVAPKDIDRVLEEKARGISEKLAEDAKPPFDLPEVKPVADTMLAALNDPVSPAGEMTLHSYRIVPDTGFIGIEEYVYAIPNFPAPAPTMPKEYHDAITSEVVEQFPELAEKFPNPPYDLTYITYFGELPIAQYLEELQKFDADHQQIPSVWFGGKPLFLDLVVEREELQDDGSWGNRIIVDPLPGQYSFREAMNEKLDVRDRNYMFDELLKPEVQSAIIQPEFLATRRGSWQPVSVDEINNIEEKEVVDLDDPIANLDRLIKRLQRNRDRIATQLEEAGGPLEGGDEPGTGSDQPRGGSPGGSGGGRPGKGGGGSMTADPGAADDRNKKTRISLTKALKKIDDQLAAKQAEREELAGALVVEEVEDEGPADRIMVWGHDIDVEAGRTYRYRMTMKVLNPFFARKLNLAKEQQDLADAVALESAPSEWCEPITVNPSVRIFLTSARAADNRESAGVSGGAGSASFEVFKFHDGLTWSEKFIVEPGDRIGEQKRVTLRGPDNATKDHTIDFGTQWLVVDIIAHTDAAPAGGIGAGENEGLLAKAVLMDLATGEITELRDPRADKFSPVRRELLEEVEISESAAFDQEN